MPSVKNIMVRTEKKLDLTRFFPLDEGETEAFITIKKMTKTLDKKLALMANLKMTNKTNQALFDGLEKNGITFEEAKNYESLSDEKKNLLVKIYLNADVDQKEKQAMVDLEEELDRKTFEACIDPEKHNFYDDKKNKIDVSNYDFWNSLGNSELIKLILESIKEFSNDFFFKPNGETESDGQSVM